MGIEPILYNCREHIPTERTVEEAVQLANRTGMTSVIGIGPNSILDLAKGTQYLLESRSRPFPSVPRPYTSNFKIPLIIIPTSPMSDSYQPSILLNDLNSYTVSRYPLPNTPHRIELIPSLISEALSAESLFSQLSPAEMASMYYCTVIARYYDLFHSYFYLERSSELAKHVPSSLGQELYEFSGLCGRCDSIEGTSSSLETLYSRFHQFNLHTASLSTSLYQLSHTLSPKTNPTQLALMDSVLEIGYFQQLKKRLAPIPDPFLRTLILNGTLKMVSADDDSHEMRCLQESYRALCHWLNVQPQEFLVKDINLNSLGERIGAVIGNDKQYWIPAAGGGP